MPRISKNSSTYSGKKNVDISGLINNNQIGGKKAKVNVTKTNKKYNNDDDNMDNSEYGSDNSDFEENESDNEEQDDVEQDDVEQDDVEQDDMEQDDMEQDDMEQDDDKYSEKSDKESNAGDEVGDTDYDKNYIDDEETLKKKCYSKYAKVDYDELDFDEMFGDEKTLIEKNIRISKPVLTKYEFVRLLTDRTKQLAQGAKHMLKNTKELSSKEIAKLEIKEGVIPLIIERPIPNSKSERWKISELQVPEHFFSM